MTPTISVILPVRNGARFLDLAIRSVLRQTWTDFELLVIDNGSTDASNAIARQHACDDPRVNIIHFSEPGQALAMNEGLRRARGAFIARMDADDVAEPARFERQMRILVADPDIAVLGTYGWMIGEAGTVISQSRVGPTTRAEFESLKRQGDLPFLLHPSVIYRRDVVTTLGGYRQEYAPSEDVDLWSRVADEHIVLTLPETLLHYRVHASSLSTSRFLEQMAKVRWAQRNMQLRRAGKPEWTRVEFDAWEADQPLMTRVSRNLAMRSQQSYRRAGGLLADQRPSGLLWLGWSFAQYPPLPVRRLRRHRVFPLIAHVARSRARRAWPASAGPRAR